MGSQIYKMCKILIKLPLIIAVKSNSVKQILLSLKYSGPEIFVTSRNKCAALTNRGMESQKIELPIKVGRYNPVTGLLVSLKNSGLQRG